MFVGLCYYYGTVGRILYLFLSSHGCAKSRQKFERESKERDLKQKAKDETAASKQKKLAKGFVFLREADLLYIRISMVSNRGHF